MAVNLHISDIHHNHWVSHSDRRQREVIPVLKKLNQNQQINSIKKKVPSIIQTCDSHTDENVIFQILTEGEDRLLNVNSIQGSTATKYL